MVNDLDLIKQLEKEIGIELKEREFTEIESYEANGFSMDERGYVTGLNLDKIELDTLPASLSKFQYLKKLSLSTCGITDISFIKGFCHLTILDIRNNKIKILPKEIVALGMDIDLEPKYWLDKEGILLNGNPLESPPVEILKRGKETLRVYFKSLEGKKRAPTEVKVLLVGDGGAGKTSLMKRLLDKEFNENEPQTHGININHKWESPPGKVIKINFWDFGGQEIMHATHQFFLSKRSLYVLVLDGRKDEKAEYWIKHIQSFGGDSPVLVVLNKIDQNPGFELNRKFLQKKYKNIKGFYRVSCKTKEGIEDFSKNLINQLTKVEMIKTMWANSWFNVKTKLENLREKFISYDQYKKMCEDEKIFDRRSQDTLVGFLNDLGVVLHFKDFELEDTHILEPGWVTYAVYKIITSEITVRCNGLLNLKWMDKILQRKSDEDYDYSRDKYTYIIALMKKFELCYSIDDETVLIPDLLARPEPDMELDYADALKFIIQYDFLPRSVMPRFIVNMHSDIKDRLQWRTGVVLENKDLQATAAVKIDHEEKRIYIYVTGRQKRDYFAVILAALRNINRSFEKLETTEMVPIPDEPGIIVDYEHLIRLEEENIEYYLPGKSKMKYKVSDLLGSIGGKIEEDETMQIFRRIKVEQTQRKSTGKKRGQARDTKEKVK